MTGRRKRGDAARRFERAVSASADNRPAAIATTIHIAIAITTYAGTRPASGIGTRRRRLNVVGGRRSVRLRVRPRRKSARGLRAEHGARSMAWYENAIGLIRATSTDSITVHPY